MKVYASASIVHGYGSGKPLLILVMPNGVAAMIELAAPLKKERANMTDHVMNGANIEPELVAHEGADRSPAKNSV
jgi:hypothetical protein